MLLRCSWSSEGERHVNKPLQCKMTSAVIEIYTKHSRNTEKRVTISTWENQKDFIRSDVKNTQKESSHNNTQGQLVNHTLHWLFSVLNPKEFHSFILADKSSSEFSWTWVMLSVGFLQTYFVYCIHLFKINFIWMSLDNSYSQVHHIYYTTPYCPTCGQLHSLILFGSAWHGILLVLY